MNITRSDAQMNDKIQVLRAVAIIAVVFIHTCPSGICQIICRPFINFAVALFLFLSGYLTNIENAHWKTFFKKRITRVIIPYVLWTIIYSVIRESCSLKVIVINLLSAGAAGTLYYILVYIQFVLLTPLMGKLAKSQYQWLGWCIAPISLVIFKYIPLVSGHVYPSIIRLVWSNACLGWFSFYYLGLIFGNGIIIKRYKTSRLIIFYVVGLVVNMLESYWWQQLGDNNFGTQLKLSSFIASTIFLLLAYNYLRDNNKPKVNHILKILGDYSFGIFLIHLLVLRILSSTSYYSTLPFLINSAIILITSVFLVYIGDRLLNAKLIRWIGLK